MLVFANVSVKIIEWIIVCHVFNLLKKVRNYFFLIIYLFDNTLCYLEMLTDLWQTQDFQ